MSDMNMDKCMICLKSILRLAKSIQCAVCNMMYNLQCITLSTEYIDLLAINQHIWCCSHCLRDMFPFNQIEDDTDYISAIEDLALSSSLSYLSDKLFLPFELIDDDHMTNLCNADPDLLKSVCKQM